MVEEMLALAKELAGAAEGEERVLRALCAAAEREIGGMERDREVLICAGAYLAAAGLLAGRSGASGGSWKVGEVSFSGASGCIEASAALRQQAYRLLCGQAGEFVFRGVKG